MREVLTDQGKFKISDSIKELPIDRFTEFQKYILQDSGIGSTIEDVYRHSERLDAFLSSAKISEAVAERVNQHYNFFFMLNKVNITHFSFAVFVDSINDQPIEDYSEGGLKIVCEKLAKVKLRRGELEDILEDVKKKLIAS